MLLLTVQTTAATAISLIMPVPLFELNINDGQYYYLSEYTNNEATPHEHPLTLQTEYFADDADQWDNQGYQGLTDAAAE